MIRSTAAPPGTPCWIDLGVPDVEEAKAYYSTVFGWTYSGGEPEFGGYLNARVGEHAVAGLGPQMDPDDPPRWSTFFSTDDAQATCARIREGGGTVHVEPMAVGPLGIMVVALDPQGLPFGLWQADSMVGASMVGEPGSFIWNELESPDPAASRVFYAAVFSWSQDPVEGESDYTSIRIGDAPEMYGGIGGTVDLAESKPGWLTYFCVTDTDAVTDAARTAGGKVLLEPQDSDYGRMSRIIDPWGATFALITAP